MRRILGAALLALVALAGCGSAKAGDSCEQPECLNSSTAFFCPSGVYESVPCRGPQGCTTSSTADEVLVVCDETLDVSGDNCGMEFAGSIICGSAGGDLQCGGSGQWTPVTCPMQCSSGSEPGGPPPNGICM